MKPDNLGFTEDRRPMETMSETSEATTTTAASEYQGFDYNEDITVLARQLGIDNLEDLKRERFRVNRRRLEQMLTGEDESLERADVFFEKV
ncbi:hypothetical protein KQX54_010575 [Cotesia glomerata]|uniref:BICC1 first type I KH domain-containing protein n=1 Tax=Cotesia glomerata TaxID=32391 RepID=A0AAV7HQV8_COTGL|nr:hypothetical protein KQX54_010575 [Cotesia glomerata]